jgi:Flp pilus assembly protein TadG
MSEGEVAVDLETKQTNGNGITKHPQPDPKQVMSLLTRFRRCERGAVFLEFALVMIPFFILLFGIFEVGIMFWASYELENATADTARLIRTGQVYSGSIDENAFKQKVCEKVAILVNCASKLRINVESYSSFADMTPPNPLEGDGSLKTSMTYSPGGAKQVVLLTTFYEWPLLNMISSMSLSNMASGNRLLRSSAAFRNEPFPE